MRRTTELRADPAKIGEWQDRSRQKARDRARERSGDDIGGSLVSGRPKRRRKPLKTRYHVKRAIDREASEAWAHAAQSKPCAVCGNLGNRHGHHVLYQQWLREVARTEGLDYERLRWDKRNLLTLCKRHHKAHHDGVRPVPLHVIREHAPKVFQMARELGLKWRLDRTYPSVASPGRIDEINGAAPQPRPAPGHLRRASSR